MTDMTDRAKVEQKLASVRARDARLKSAGEKLSRGLSKAASSTRGKSARIGKRFAA